MRISIVLLFVSVVSVVSVVSGQEIAQFRGPLRDGNYPDKGLLKKWPDAGLKPELQITGIGKGYSQPVECNGIIYVTGIKQDTLDMVSAYDLKGTLLWSQVYGRAWTNSYPYARSTPTFQNDKIYLVSGMGTVCCCDALTGKIIWSQDAQNQFNGKYHMWGISESVLLTDQAATYVVGGDETTVVAFDKITGKFLWKTKCVGGARAYASSILIERNGMKVILAQTMNDVIGINSLDGEVLWNFDLTAFQPGAMGKGVNTNSCLYQNGEIFVTSGYEHPAIMISLSDDCRAVQLKWKNDTMDTHHGGVVLIDGNIFGTNWINNSKGDWVSMNWKTGKVNWTKSWIAKGSVIAADGMLYCFEEKSGTIALVQPDTTDFKIVSTFKMEGGEGPYWAHPAIYHGKLYLRHGNVLQIYSI
jgi:outer membrane protein assembly factor BamB